MPPTHRQIDNNVTQQGTNIQKGISNLKQVFYGQPITKNYPSDPNRVPQTPKVVNEKLKEAEEKTAQKDRVNFFASIYNLLLEIKQAITGTNPSTGITKSNSNAVLDKQQIENLAKGLSDNLVSNITKNETFKHFFTNIERINKNLSQTVTTAGNIVDINEKLAKFYNFSGNTTLADYIVEQLNKAEFSKQIADSLKIEFQQKDLEQITKSFNTALTNLFSKISIEGQNFTIDTKEIKEKILASITGENIDLTAIIKSKFGEDSSYEKFIKEQLAQIINTFKTNINATNFTPIVTTINNKINDLTFKDIDLNKKINVTNINFKDINDRIGQLDSVFGTLIANSIDVNKNLNTLNETLKSLNVNLPITKGKTEGSSASSSSDKAPGTAINSILVTAQLDKDTNDALTKILGDIDTAIKNVSSYLKTETPKETEGGETLSDTLSAPVKTLDQKLDNIASKITNAVNNIFSQHNLNSIQSKFDSSLKSILGDNAKNITTPVEKISNGLIGKSGTKFTAPSGTGTSGSLLKFGETEVRDWNTNLSVAKDYLNEDIINNLKTDEDWDKFNEVVGKLQSTQNTLLDKTSASISDTNIQELFDKLLEHENLSEATTIPFNTITDASSVNKKDLEDAYKKLFIAIDEFNTHTFDELDKINLTPKETNDKDQLIKLYQSALDSLHRGVRRTKSPVINTKLTTGKQLAEYNKNRLSRLVKESGKVPGVLSVTTTPENFNFRNYFTKFGVYATLEDLLNASLGKKLNKINTGIGGIAIKGEGGEGGEGSQSKFGELVSKFTSGDKEGGSKFGDLVSKFISSGKGGGLNLGSQLNGLNSLGNLGNLAKLGGIASKIGGTGSLLGAGGALGAAGALAGGALVAGVAAAGVHGAMNATKWDRQIGNVNNESLMPKWLGGTYADGAFASINHYLGEGLFSRIGTAWKSGKWSKLWGKNNQLDDEYTEAEHKALMSLGKDRADQLKHQRQDKIITERVTNAREQNIHFGLQQTINDLKTGVENKFNKSFFTGNLRDINPIGEISVSSLSGMNRQQLTDLSQHYEKVNKLRGYSQKMMGRQANDLRNAWNVLQNIDDKEVGQKEKGKYNAAVKQLLEKNPTDLRPIPSLKILKETEKTPLESINDLTKLKQWQQELIDFTDTDAWQDNDRKIDKVLASLTGDGKLEEDERYNFKRHFLTYHNKWLYLIISDLINSKEAGNETTTNKMNAESINRLKESNPGLFKAPSKEGGMLLDPDEARARAAAEAAGYFNETEEISPSQVKVNPPQELAKLVHMSFDPSKSKTLTIDQQNQVNEFIGTKEGADWVNQLIINVLPSAPVVTVVKDVPGQSPDPAVLAGRQGGGN